MVECVWRYDGQTWTREYVQPPDEEWRALGGDEDVMVVGTGADEVVIRDERSAAWNHLAAGDVSGITGRFAAVAGLGRGRFAIGSDAGDMRVRWAGQWCLRQTLLNPDGSPVTTIARILPFADQSGALLLGSPSTGHAGLVRIDLPKP
jgi:hypothetical protein